MNISPDYLVQSSVFKYNAKKRMLLTGTFTQGLFHIKCHKIHSNQWASDITGAAVVCWAGQYPLPTLVSLRMNVVLGKAEWDTTKCIFCFPSTWVVSIFCLFIDKAKVLENWKYLSKLRCAFLNHLSFYNVFANSGLMFFPSFLSFIKPCCGKKNQEEKGHNQLRSCVCKS